MIFVHQIHRMIIQVARRLMTEQRDVWAIQTDLLATPHRPGLADNGEGMSSQVPATWNQYDPLSLLVRAAHLLTAAEGVGDQATRTGLVDEAMLCYRAAYRSLHTPILGES